jgi:dipeptidyl aminopeptidase/acylaminoacyl peptidase
MLPDGDEWVKRQLLPGRSCRLYHALKDHGVPVSMVAYPVPGHFPGDPIRSRDVYRR